MTNENPQDIKEPKERSGNYRIVKICIHEIEAMKKLGFSRQTILDRLETHFGNTMTPDHLSANVNRIKKEIESRDTKEEAQLRKERIAEIVKNPELIPKNFHTYQLIINPNSVESIVSYERRVSPPQAPAKIQQPKSVAPLSPPTKQTRESTPQTNLEKHSVLAPANIQQGDVTDEMVDKWCSNWITTYKTFHMMDFPQPKMDSLKAFVLENWDWLQVTNKNDVRDSIIKNIINAK